MSRSESLPTRRRTLRWILWLGAGVSFGVLAGFAAALAARGPDAEPSAHTESGSPAAAAGGGRR